jgi:hypothetical protein
MKSSPLRDRMNSTGSNGDGGGGGGGSATGSAIGVPTGPEAGAGAASGARPAVGERRASELVLAPEIGTGASRRGTAGTIGSTGSNSNSNSNLNPRDRDRERAGSTARSQHGDFDESRSRSQSQSQSQSQTQSQNQSRSQSRNESLPPLMPHHQFPDPPQTQEHLAQHARMADSRDTQGGMILEHVDGVPGSGSGKGGKGRGRAGVAEDDNLGGEFGTGSTGAPPEGYRI